MADRQEFYDVGAAALDLLRAHDFPYTVRVDRLAEMLVVAYAHIEVLEAESADDEEM